MTEELTEKLESQEENEGQDDFEDDGNPDIESGIDHDWHGYEPERYNNENVETMVDQAASERLNQILSESLDPKVRESAKFIDHCELERQKAKRRGDPQAAFKWAQRIEYAAKDILNREPSAMEIEVDKRVCSKLENNIIDLMIMDEAELSKASPQAQQDAEEILMRWNDKYADRAGYCYVTVDKSGDPHIHDIEGFSGDNIKRVSITKNAKQWQGGLSWVAFRSQGNPAKMDALRNYLGSLKVLNRKVSIKFRKEREEAGKHANEVAEWIKKRNEAERKRKQ